MDTFRNELLRAINLRLTVLKEELAVSFNRAAGTTLSTKQISDIEAFAHHFGAVDLRYAVKSLVHILPTVCQDIDLTSLAEMTKLSIPLNSHACGFKV